MSRMQNKNFFITKQTYLFTKQSKCAVYETILAESRVFY